MRTELIDLLTEMSSLEPDQYKSRAYKNATDSLRKLSDSEFSSRTSFLDLSGIGNSINSIILAYKDTGKIQRLENLRFIQKDFLTSDYKVRKTYVSKRISYERAYDLFSEILNLTGSEGFHAVAGSVRRHKAKVADIDILVWADHYDRFIEILSRNYSMLTSGEEKSSFCMNNQDLTQIDVVKVTPRTAAYQLLYLTGSKEFNIRMRGIAKSKGYVLNQHGLYKNGKRFEIAAQDESDIFGFLGMDYVKPEFR